MKKILFSLCLLTTILSLQSVSWAKSVNLTQSSFNWTGTKKIGSKHTGNIFLKSAVLKEQGDAIVGAELITDMTSFTVTDLEGENREKFLAHMKSEDFFATAQYPTAKLVIESMKDGVAKGQLTIKNQTQPVAVSFKQDGNVYTGTLNFDRTKYGMVYNSPNFFKNLLADRVINNEVTIEFKVVVE